VTWLGYVLAAVGSLAALALILIHADPESAVLTVIAVAAPLPLLACVALAPAAFEIDSRFGHSLNLVLIFPVASLLIVTLNTPLARPEVSWVMAGVGTGFALLIGLWAPTRATVAGPRVLLVFLCLFGAGYGWSAPLLADLRFDHAPSQAFQAPVVGRGVSYGGRSRTRYYLRLGPWGPVSRTTTVVVPHATYLALNTGDQACVTLHPGALAMPWFSAAIC